MKLNAMEFLMELQYQGPVQESDEDLGGKFKHLQK